MDIRNFLKKMNSKIKEYFSLIRNNMFLYNLFAIVQLKSNGIDTDGELNTDVLTARLLVSCIQFMHNDLTTL